MRLDFIRPLYERPGPCTSIYRAGRAIFTVHDEVVLAEQISTPPPDFRGLAPLPHVTPLLMARGENVPHLRVIAGSAGFELTAVGGGSPRHATERPSPWPLQKTAQGGWARRLDAPGTDPVTLAGEIDEQVRRIGAELVVVAGDPARRSLICDNLGTKSADRVLMVEHGRDADHVRDAETALDGWLDRRRAELLDRYRAASGPSGLAEVGHVLRGGRAHAVLTPGELPQPMWTGPGATQLATGPAELRRWGVDEPVPDRADSAIARAAAMTDAELWFCPELLEVAAVITY